MVKYQGQKKSPQIIIRGDIFNESKIQKNI